MAAAAVLELKASRKRVFEDQLFNAVPRVEDGYLHIDERPGWNALGGELAPDLKSDVVGRTPQSIRPVQEDRDAERHLSASQRKEPSHEDHEQ